MLWLFAGESKRSESSKGEIEGFLKLGGGGGGVGGVGGLGWEKKNPTPKGWWGSLIGVLAVHNARSRWRHFRVARKKWCYIRTYGGKKKEGKLSTVT